jgi:hypothetical protein
LYYLMMTGENRFGAIANRFPLERYCDAFIRPITH